MNNFEAKYIKLSAEYLEEKLKKLDTKVKSAYILEDKKESTLHKLFNSLFKS
jgi:hypothetical protein